VARRDGQEFDCATWLHKARSLPKDEFKREVERELTGRESESWKMISNRDTGYQLMGTSQATKLRLKLQLAPGRLQAELSGLLPRGSCCELASATDSAQTKRCTRRSIGQATN
jgi:hypothetical protein